MKLAIAALFVLFAFPAKADWICEGNICYPSPPPEYVDVLPDYPDYPLYPERRPVHNFRIRGEVVAVRNCAVIKGRGRVFSLLCR